MKTAQDRLRLVRWPWLLAIALVLALAAVLVYLNGWQAHAREWLGLAVRWLHVIYGVAWIGASFYFIFLENALERPGPRDELAGNIWTIHGGGIYYLEKYKVVPKRLPPYLHWFKWDAYFTWLTGFLLLVIVYFANPQATLLKPASPLSPALGVALAVSSLALAWLLYAGLSRTRLLYRPLLFALAGLAFFTLAAYLFSQVYSGRGAFIMVGAMIGTIMAGNVMFVIIPSQKALLSKAAAGEALSSTFVERVQLRSVHNNYLTLPVLFTMISNHYPMTYSSQLNWLVLLLLFVAGGAVRHSINATEKRHHETLRRGGALPYLLVLAAALVVAALYLTAPRRALPQGEAVAFSQVAPIVAERCAACHAERPSQPGFSAPPQGVLLESPAQIRAAAEQIRAVAVESEYMPLGNLTGMTEAEREMLGRWINQGAPIPQ